MQFVSDEIQNYLVNRSLQVEKAHDVHEFFDIFRCIQVDPIVVIARSHDLSLWNRIEGYTLGTLEKELYETRSLFEYWMQLYSIIPIKFRPFVSARMKAQGIWHDDFYAAHKNEVELARDHIIQNGPTAAKEGIK